MNTLIEAGRVWYVDCTPENGTHIWNIASPNTSLLARIMKALWDKVDHAAKAAH